MSKGKKPFTRILEQLATLGRMGLQVIEGQQELKNAVNALKRRDREQPLTICFKHVEPWSTRYGYRPGEKDAAEKYRREMIAREITEALLKHGIVQITEKSEEMGMTYTVELRLWGVDLKITAQFFDRDRAEMRSFGGGGNGWI